MRRVELCLPFQGMLLCILSKVQSCNEEWILSATGVVPSVELTASTAAHSPNNQTARSSRRKPWQRDGSATQQRARARQDDYRHWSIYITISKDLIHSFIQPADSLSRKNCRSTKVWVPHGVKNIRDPPFKSPHPVMVDENLKWVRCLGMKSHSYPMVVWMTRSAEDEDQITILIQVCALSKHHLI